MTKFNKKLEKYHAVIFLPFLMETKQKKNCKKNIIGPLSFIMQSQNLNF